MNQKMRAHIFEENDSGLIDKMLCWFFYIAIFDIFGSNVTLNSAHFIQFLIEKKLLYFKKHILISQLIR